MPFEVLRQWLSGNPSYRAGDTIWREAARLNSRSMWRPVLRGRLLRTDSGSAFIGVVGCDPVLKLVSCCRLGAFAGMLLTGTVVAVWSAVHADRHAAGPALAVSALGLFGVLTSLASILVGYRETREQAAYLRSWITGQMNTPWYQGRRTADQ